MWPNAKNLTLVEINKPIIKEVFSPWDRSQIGSVECIKKNDVKNIVAYNKSYKLYIKLSKYFKNRNGVNADEDVLEAISASAVIPAKIAGGHGMGYEKDTLCGNIANCKRSLKNARKCIYMLEIVRAKSTCPDSDINILISDTIKVEREVLKRIEYLRSRIWWR